MVSENIRIKFRKTGSLRYISHLDLCRTVCPAMIRAGIPLWYTEGFNPHPKMVFTQPLPLFAESLCEFLDIKITEELPTEEICRRLRSAFTDELFVEEVYIPKTRFSDIAYAGYNITGFEVFSVGELLSGEIRVLKKNKNCEKEIDIRPQIKLLENRENGEIFAVLDASGSSYLNPEMLCRAIAERYGYDSRYGITRVRWYNSDMSVFR